MTAQLTELVRNNSHLHIRRCTASALGVSEEQAQVAIKIDGRTLLVTFDLDPLEHSRRQAIGLGAVVSRPLLHALWLLPGNGTVSAMDLPRQKLERLRKQIGLVSETPAGLVRLYSLPGRVTGIVISGKSPDRVVDATVIQSPVFRRLARIEANYDRVRRLMPRALGAGVGLACCDGDDLQVVLAAPAPILGVPGVFRWWIAELAYEAWLQDNSQPVNCALGSVGPRPPMSYRAAAALQNSRNTRR